MCGFTFVIDKTKQLTGTYLTQQINTLSHRGPDFGDSLLKKMDNYHLGFIHNRLSIIDLTNLGNQPMESEKGILVFNGEIYNYRELAKKYQLKTDSTSDTEVLIKGLELIGEEFISQLNGMFAFCFYNKLNGKVLIARDRLGVKPLYFSKSEDKIVFSSEIKGILPFISRDKLKLNTNEVFNYFRDGCTSRNGTLFQNIGKIPPGHFCKIEIENQNKFELHQYWKYKKSKREKIINFNELVEELEEILIDSIRLRLRSDVPLGIYLSGGYDSSLIASVASEINQNTHTYSIGLENTQYDESKYAALIAKKIGTTHTTFKLNEENVDQGMLEKLIAAIDDPIADPSIIPNFYLNMMASNHIKVALTGDGGDELFAGYNSYLITTNNWSISKSSLSKYLRIITGSYALRKNRKISRINSFLGQQHITDLHKEITSVFNSDYIKDVVFNQNFVSSIGTEIKNYEDEIFKSKLHELLSYDIENDLPNKLLLKTDRTSMAFGVEARDPLLDFRLFDLAAETNQKLFFNGKNGKYPIKHLANKRIGNSLLNRPKTGFNIPIDQICSNLFRNNEWIFDAELIKRQGIFNPTYIKYLKNNKDKGGLNYRHLYSYFIFQIWYYKWFKT